MSVTKSQSCGPRRFVRTSTVSTWMASRNRRRFHMLLFVSFYFPLSFHLDSTPSSALGWEARAEGRAPISRNRSLNFHPVSMENKRKQKATCGRSLPSSQILGCHPSGNCRGPNKSQSCVPRRFRRYTGECMPERRRRAAVAGGKQCFQDSFTWMAEKLRVDGQRHIGPGDPREAAEDRGPQCVSRTRSLGWQKSCTSSWP